MSSFKTWLRDAKMQDTTRELIRALRSDPELKQYQIGSLQDLHNYLRARPSYHDAIAAAPKLWRQYLIWQYD